MLRKLVLELPLEADAPVAGLLHALDGVHYKAEADDQEVFEAPGCVQSKIISA